MTIRKSIFIKTSDNGKVTGKVVDETINWGERDKNNLMRRGRLWWLNVIWDASSKNETLTTPKKEKERHAHTQHTDEPLHFLFQKYNANHNDNYRVMVNNCDNKDHGRIPEHDEADSYCRGPRTSQKV